MLNRCLHINRIPNRNSIDDKIETIGLVEVFLGVFFANETTIGRINMSAQGMKLFTFVKLISNSPTVGFAFEVMQDEIF